MKTEDEIRDQRDKIIFKRNSLKHELKPHLRKSIKNSILAEIGEHTILIHWFDWVLDEERI